MHEVIFLLKITTFESLFCDLRCSSFFSPFYRLIPAKSHVELSLLVRCEHVHYLEHVQAKITLTASRRGDIHIYLTSPAGTR